MKTVSRASKMLVRIAGFAIVITFSLLMPTASNCATDLVFIRMLKSSEEEQEHLKTATDFYGLNLKVVVANSASDGLEISKAVQRKETLGVAVAADALTAVNQDALLRSLHRERGEDIPLLILGVDPLRDPIELRDWSVRAGFGC